MTRATDDYRKLVRSLSERVVEAQRPIRILDAVKWDDSVRERFFAAGCKRQPEVDRAYYETRPALDSVDETHRVFAQLDRDLERWLDADDPAGRMMRRMCSEYETVLRMLAARGTREFHACSVELFGRAGDPFHAGGPSLVELAELLDESLRNLDGSSFIHTQQAHLSASQAVEILQGRLDQFLGGGGLVHVRIDDGIIADAAAGSDYIKLRADAMFRESDLRVLEVHEGWVHVGTTLNGQAQPICTFLGKGTPSTTITQEGLALFVEVISFSSHPRRLRRVTDRIRAIRWAETGATFLDVFDRLREEGRSEVEAWPTCVRVFRGSTPELGPFTKDLSYSRGFIEVYNFVRLAVQRGRLDRVRLLFCGKLTLSDIADVARLHESGLIVDPRHLPIPLAEPSALAAWMAYSNFLNRLDLGRLAGELAKLLE
jgi:uncharacterized protein (TIGR02421 family)